MCPTPCSPQSNQSPYDPGTSSTPSGPDRLYVRRPSSLKYHTRVIVHNLVIDVAMRHHGGRFVADEFSRVERPRSKACRWVTFLNGAITIARYGSAAKELTVVGAVATCAGKTICRKDHFMNQGKNDHDAVCLAHQGFARPIDGSRSCWIHEQGADQVAGQNGAEF
jgi:hypothetical protein